MGLSRAGLIVYLAVYGVWGREMGCVIGVEIICCYVEKIYNPFLFSFSGPLTSLLCSRARLLLIKPMTSNDCLTIRGVWIQFVPTKATICAIPERFCIAFLIDFIRKSIEREPGKTRGFLYRIAYWFHKETKEKEPGRTRGVLYRIAYRFNQEIKVKGARQYPKGFVSNSLLSQCDNQ